MTYQAMVNRWVIPVIERHKSEGRVDGQRTLVERLLRRRFGSLSPEVEERVAGASAVDLETWADKILYAETLDEVFNSIHKE